MPAKSTSLENSGWSLYKSFWNYNFEALESDLTFILDLTGNWFGNFSFSFYHQSYNGKPWESIHEVVCRWKKKVVNGYLCRHRHRHHHQWPLLIISDENYPPCVHHHYNYRSIIITDRGHEDNQDNHHVAATHWGFISDLSALQCNDKNINRLCEK